MTCLECIHTTYTICDCAQASYAVAGDGFVTDAAIISKYDFTDPRRFFNELLKRPYKSRVLLAPHLYGPSVSGVPAAPPFEVAARVDSSWGVLATDGYCNGNQCMRLPVVAGKLAVSMDIIEKGMRDHLQLLVGSASHILVYHHMHRVGVYTS